MKTLELALIITLGIVLGILSKYIIKWITKNKIVTTIQQIFIISAFIITTNILSFFTFSLSLNFLLFTYLEYFLIIVAFVDYLTMEIPNKLIITGLIGGLLISVLRIFLVSEYSWVSPIIGITFSLFLVLINLICNAIYKKDAFGGGDIKLFAVIGIFLGIEVNVLVFLLSAVLSIIFGLTVNAYRKIVSKKCRLENIPFGPFITLATVFYISVYLVLKLSTTI